jgi:hypothetical protein
LTTINALAMANLLTGAAAVEVDGTDGNVDAPVGGFDDAGGGCPLPLDGGVDEGMDGEILGDADPRRLEGLPFGGDADDGGGISSYLYLWCFSPKHDQGTKNISKTIFVVRGK